MNTRAPEHFPCKETYRLSRCVEFARVLKRPELTEDVTAHLDKLRAHRPTLGRATAFTLTAAACTDCRGLSAY